MEGPGAPTILIAAKAEIGAPIAQALESAGFAVRLAASPNEVLAALHADPPQCMILPHELPGTSSLSLLEELKADNIYGHLPAIVLVDKGSAGAVDWRQVPADDFLECPVGHDDLITRIRLSIARSQRDVNANPLTGLPGNITIMREAERRIIAGEPFAMAYADLDHFKPFNDKYGFSRGDEVLRMAARILVNHVGNLASKDTYVGHVGGDDFIFLTPPALMAKACDEVIRTFDLIVPNFYDEDDRESGQITAMDRNNCPRTYPLMGCSIAVIDTSITTISHLAQLSARAAEAKKCAKAVAGSSYFIDRRE